MTAAAGGDVTALILAGRRGGIVDPLATAAGVSAKCLAPVAGRAMIVHVLDAVDASDRVGRIVVSASDPAELRRLPEVAALIASGRLAIVESRDNLADSVLTALADAHFPVVVTTADNVLLTAAAIAALDRDACRSGADVAVAFARRESILAANPDGQRRFYTFRDGAFSNCNSYWIGSREALGIAELFRGGGQFAKFPFRIVRAFGLANLIRFRFGLGTLPGVFARLSRRFRLNIRPTILTDGAIAIDVDNARTLQIAEQLLLQRRPSPA